MILSIWFDGCWWVAELVGCDITVRAITFSEALWLEVLW